MLLTIDVGNTETVIGLFDLSVNYASREGDQAASSREGDQAAKGVEGRGDGNVSLEERAAPLVKGDKGAKGGRGGNTSRGGDGNTISRRNAGIRAGYDEKQYATYLAGLVHHWRTSTIPERTADEYAMNLFHLLSLVGLRIDSTVTGIVVTSSVPSAATALKEMTSRWLPGIKLVVLEPGLRSGMPILYDDPREVGPDRIANAIGAFSIYGGPCIVADLGTATTVDGISASGEYLGGAIMPGVSISMDALFAHAAALRQVTLAKPKSVIGRSTAESIRSGILYGFAGQLDSMCNLFRQELGENTTVVATGGLAEMIVPYCQSVDYLNSWLTLYGLKLVYLHSTADGSAAGNEGSRDISRASLNDEGSRDTSSDPSRDEGSHNEIGDPLYNEGSHDTSSDLSRNEGSHNAI